MAEDRYLFGYFFTVLNKDSIMTQAIRDAAASLSRRSRSRSRLARWRIAFAPALLALAALSGLVQTATAQDKPLRMSSAVHGVAIDGNNKLVVLNASNIPAMQEALIKRLRANFSGDALARFDKAAQDLMSRAGDNPGRQNWARFILIASLNKSKNLSEQNIIQAQNMRLASKLSSFTGDPIEAPNIMANKLPDWIGELDPQLLNPVLGRLGDFRRYNDAYAADCIRRGVPIPPPLKMNADNDPSPTAANGWKIATRTPQQLADAGLPASKAQWQIHSYLEPSQTPAAPGQPALANKISKMYYWFPDKAAKQQGLCIANPIIDVPGAAEPRVTAFGIICSSLSERITKITNPLGRRYVSHACFWDNNGSLRSDTTHALNDGSFLAPPEPLTAATVPGVHLPDDNRCTECHTGDKAFIVMTDPDLGIDDANAIAVKAYDDAHPSPTANFHNQSNWFVPLVQANWQQNTFRAYPAGVASNPNDPANCGSCHKPSTGYAAGRLPHVVGVNPRDNLYKFCSFMLPNFLTKSTDPTFDTPGLMHSYWSLAQPGGVKPLYDACKSIFPGNSYPPDVGGNAFPPSISTWLQPAPN